jgi:hypothetical protein
LQWPKLVSNKLKALERKHYLLVATLPEILNHASQCSGESMQRDKRRSLLARPFLLAAFLKGRCQVLLFAMLRFSISTQCILRLSRPPPRDLSQCCAAEFTARLSSRGGFKEHARATLSISTSTGSIISDAHTCRRSKG